MLHFLFYSLLFPCFIFSAGGDFPSHPTDKIRVNQYQNECNDKGIWWRLTVPFTIKNLKRYCTSYESSEEIPVLLPLTKVVFDRLKYEYDRFNIINYHSCALILEDLFKGLEQLKVEFHSAFEATQEATHPITKAFSNILAAKKEISFINFAKKIYVEGKFVLHLDLSFIEQLNNEEFQKIFDTQLLFEEIGIRYEKDKILSKKCFKELERILVSLSPKLREKCVNIFLSKHSPNCWNLVDTLLEKKISFSETDEVHSFIKHLEAIFDEKEKKYKHDFVAHFKFLENDFKRRYKYDKDKRLSKTLEDLNPILENFEKVFRQEFKGTYLSFENAYFIKGLEKSFFQTQMLKWQNSDAREGNFLYFIRYLCYNNLAIRNKKAKEIRKCAFMYLCKYLVSLEKIESIKNNSCAVLYEGTLEKTDLNNPEKLREIFWALKRIDRDTRLTSSEFENASPPGSDIFNSFVQILSDAIKFHYSSGRINEYKKCLEIFYDVFVDRFRQRDRETFLYYITSPCHAFLARLKTINFMKNPNFYGAQFMTRDEFEAEFITKDEFIDTFMKIHPSSDKKKEENKFQTGSYSPFFKLNETSLSTPHEAKADKLSKKNNNLIYHFKLPEDRKIVASLGSTCVLSALLLIVGTLKAIKAEKKKGSLEKEETRKTSSFSGRLIRQPFFQLGTGCAVSAFIQYLFATGKIDSYILPCA